jgi:hypothetical protein
VRILIQRAIFSRAIQDSGVCLGVSIEVMQSSSVTERIEEPALSLPKAQGPG